MQPKTAFLRCEIMLDMVGRPVVEGSVTINVSTSSLT